MNIISVIQRLLILAAILVLSGCIHPYRDDNDHQGGYRGGFEDDNHGSVYHGGGGHHY